MKASFVLAALAGGVPSFAQSYCSAVTEYVTVTAGEPTATNTPSSLVAPSDTPISSPVVPSNAPISSCADEAVTSTVHLAPTTITIVPSSGALGNSPASSCANNAATSVVHLDPTTITVFASSTAEVVQETPAAGYQSEIDDEEQLPEIAPDAAPSASSPQEPASPPARPSFVLVEGPNETPAQDDTNEQVAAPSALPEASPAESETPAQPETSPAQPVDSTPVEPVTSESITGKTTFYGGNIDGGTCSFVGYTLPAGVYGTALSDSNWDGAKACGACVQVTGPDGNSIKAMVVDQCPGCGAGALDLFPDAFSALADPSVGIIQTKWSIVPCGITTPISLRNKSGASAYYFNIQVINANVQVESVEVSADGGASWKATTRKPYNYFEILEGVGAKVDVKVTSVGGETIVVEGVEVVSDKVVGATGNFKG